MHSASANNERLDGSYKVPSVLVINRGEKYVTPSPSQYIHQWLWDSAFHAIILGHFDVEWAKQELTSLFDAQWENGMVPHIRFCEDPQVRYRPNATDWGTGRNSSGITQPPLIATAARIVYQFSGDRQWLASIYDRLTRYHDWLKSARDPHDMGLAMIVHPWESGTDNSPIFDGSRERFLANLDTSVQAPPRADTQAVDASERPTDDDYKFYWGLLNIFQKVGWDPHKMVEHSPCKIADITFNSVWAQANADLAAIARELGRNDQAEKYNQWKMQTRSALRERCWDPGIGFFFPLDLTTGERIRIRTSGCFLTLYAGVPDSEMAERIVDHMLDRRSFNSPHGIPSTAFDEEVFNPRCYWRGPIWINFHWLLIQGLRRYRYPDLAHRLRAVSINLVETQGYREYYHPFTGEGLGARDFAWSALVDVTRPNTPDEFLLSVQVLRRDRLQGHPEIQTLYNHPDAQVVEPDQVTMCSTPKPIVERIVGEAQDDVRAGFAGQNDASSEARICALGEALRRVVNVRRPASETYPRICDLSSVTVTRAAQAIMPDIKARIEWVPNVHYYAVLTDPESHEWILDLSGEQFATHPASRVPLLLEVATLTTLRELEKRAPSWLYVAGLLEHTQERLDTFRLSTAPVRLSADERGALNLILKRHIDVVSQATNLQDHYSEEFIRDYLDWLEAESKRWMQR